MRKLICLILAFTACSTTSILSTWTKPGVTTLQFQKVVVVVPLKDEAKRRHAEDQLVRTLAPRPAVASYTLLPAGASAEQLRALVNAGGFDGAVVMRVQSVEQESSWVPGSYSYGMYGGYGWYDPGYMRTDTYVQVGTSVYALPGEDLLWEATSRTANPSNLADLIDEVSGALRKELSKEGLAPMPVSRRESAPPTRAQF